ncbi:MAG: arginine--tRNA ligase [Proteobacteria bacterium]|nr:arginine--tRNA ligase [Pseudomonadota bacterium]
MPEPMQSALDPFSRSALRAVVAGLSGLDPGIEFDPDAFSVAAPPRPELGDFAVGLFPAARAFKQSPAKLATRVAEQFMPGDHLEDARAAGPFINFRANRAALFRHVVQATHSGVGLISTAAGTGKTICIDYSSPNISKHLAYHHIRSTVIGSALANLYRAVGYRVIGINHLGDWGTTHGMLICAFKTWFEPQPANAEELNRLSLTIAELNELYVCMRRAIEAQRDELRRRGIEGDPTLESQSREWFKKLEDGDGEARGLWQKFRDVSWAEFQQVYRTLGIAFEEVKGESEFMSDVPAVLDMLEQKGLLAESDGAVVVPAADPNTPPLLLRKKDGATLYGTRDLAAAMYRWNTYQFERSLYVVDRGQNLHFSQVFDALARAGFDWAQRCSHVPFGLVRVGGKKTGSRSGKVVLLKEVLAEAQRRAVAVVEDNRDKVGTETNRNHVEEISRAVAVGAVIFANLSSQREKDVDFSWEQVLSTAGDSGPYIQYAHARCASILRRAGRSDGGPSKPGPSRPDDDPGALLQSEYEWALARKLIEIGSVVHRAAHQNEPHLLSRYLLDLCAVFSRWYTAGNQDHALRVLCDDPDLRAARLDLVAATQHVLARGLGLLGIDAPEAM